MAVPSNFAPYGPNAQMSFTPNVPNISTGRPAIDQVLSMLLMGSGIGPRPMAGQSVYDSYIQRQRSNDFLQVMRTSFSNQLMAQKLGGINPNSGWGSLVSTFMGNPDGIVNSPIMRAFNGGNPVKAAMALMANMSGSTYQMATGRIGNATGRDVNAYMEGMTEALFDNKIISTKDYNKFKKQKASQIMDFINADAGRKERFEPFISTIGGQETFDVDKFEKLRKSSKNFTKSIKGASEVLTDELKEATKITDEIRSYKGSIGKTRPIKYSLDKSAGFELQDLTKSFTVAQDLGLFNHRETMEKLLSAEYKKMSTSPDVATLAQKSQAEYAAKKGTMKEFMGAAHALRAAADLSGATNATDATKFLNGLASISGIDGSGRAFVKGSAIDVREDATYLEDLQSRVKANARVAGVSIEAMLDIIQQGKNLASQHPELASLGGIGTLENTLKIFRQNRAVANTLGSRYERRAGGQEAMMQKASSLDAEDRNEPYEKRMVAAYGFINNPNNGLSESTRAAANKKLAEFIQKNDLSPGMQNAFYEQMAMILGRNPNDFLAQTMDVFNYDAGMQRKEQDKQLGRKDIVEDAAARAKYNSILNYGAAYFRDEQNRRISSGLGTAFKDANGQPLTSGEDIMKYIQAQVFEMRKDSKSEAEILAGTGIGTMLTTMFPDSTPDEIRDMGTRFVRSTALHARDEKYIAANSKNGKTAKYINEAQAFEAEFKAITQAQADEEKEMRHRLSGFSGPLLTGLAQELFSGNFAGNISGFVGTIATPHAQQRVEAITKAIQAMNQDYTQESEAAAFYETRGGGQVLNENDVIKNLRKQGATPAQIQKILKERAAYTEDGREATLKVGKAGMTVEQILKFARNLDDPSVKRRMKEMGVSAEDVRLASDHLYHTGLATGERVKKYGKDAVTEEVLRKMTQDSAAEAAVDIRKDDFSKFEQNKIAKDAAFVLDQMQETEVGRAKAEKIRDMLHKSGAFTKEPRETKSITTSRLARIFSRGQTLEKSLQEAFDLYGTSGGDKNGESYLIRNKKGEITGVNRDLMVKDFDEGTMHPELIKALAAAGDIEYQDPKVVDYRASQIEDMIKNKKVTGPDQEQKLAIMQGYMVDGKFDTERYIDDLRQWKKTKDPKYWGAARIEKTLAPAAIYDTDESAKLSGEEFAYYGHQNVSDETRAQFEKDKLYSKEKGLDAEAVRKRFLGKNRYKDADAERMVKEGVAVTDANGKITAIDTAAIQKNYDRDVTREEIKGTPLEAKAKAAWDTKVAVEERATKEKEAFGLLNESLEETNKSVASMGGSLATIAASLEKLANMK